MISFKSDELECKSSTEWMQRGDDEVLVGRCKVPGFAATTIMIIIWELQMTWVKQSQVFHANCGVSRFLLRLNHSPLETKSGFGDEFSTGWNSSLSRFRLHRKPSETVRKAFLSVRTSKQHLPHTTRPLENNRNTHWLYIEFHRVHFHRRRSQIRIRNGNGNALKWLISILITAQAIVICHNRGTNRLFQLRKTTLGHKPLVENTH